MTRPSLPGICDGSRASSTRQVVTPAAAICSSSTANCIIIGHFSAFQFELVALFLTLPLKNGWQWVNTARNLNLGVLRFSS
jgi:hypothetical protein